MNLILLEGREVDEHGRTFLSDARAQHLVGVLRVAPGQQVRVGRIDGPSGAATVQSITAEGVELACTFDTPPQPKPRVDLLLALPRPKVMRRLWAQLAALGVGQIILTNAQRVERNYFDTHVLQPEFYRPLLIEGLQQARDTRLPAVSVHRQLKVLIEDQLDGLFGAGHRFVADPSGGETPAAVSQCGPDERILLAVGPEGGWSRYELNLLTMHKFRTLGMGTRTLRTDTACVALVGQLSWRP